MTEAKSLRSRCCLIGLMICLVACLACGGKPAESGTSLSRLPFGSLDIPRSGETVTGTVGIGGWALSEDGISRVAIYVDRSYVLAATLGGPRPDVAKIYPTIPDAASSGFNAALDTSSFPAGSHEIVVQAYSKLGASRDIGTATVTITK
jgi:hypothetical protein